MTPARSTRFLLPLLFPGSGLIASPAIPAFPGAEGFGAHSNGGRGGDVYIVGNLRENGPGSFLEGIRTVPPDGRTIVFAVSGWIPLNKAHLSGSKVTIAGQTAPGDGIGLRGSSLRITGSDVVIRHVRFRHGISGNGGDCLNPGKIDRLIIDHCDLMFAKDENMSMFHGTPTTMTFQWSTNAWGLYGHSCGGLWVLDHATSHHTLWANNKTRNPKVIRPKLLDWVNNVTFGWDIGMNLAGADENGIYKVNLRGSSFIHGERAGTAVFGGGVAPDGSLPFHVHVADCALDGNGSKTPDVTAGGYAIIDKDQYHRSEKPFPQTHAADPAAADPVLGVPVRVEKRTTGMKQVLSAVGPLRLDVRSEKPLRDEVTTLLVEDVKAQRRRKIASEKELPVANAGFGTLESSVAPADHDKDGMPDLWEKTLGSNPARQDHNRPVEAGPDRSFFPPGTPAGFTLLEEYLHFLATPHAVLAPGEALVVDLRRVTSGFANKPVFKLSSIRGGTAAIGRDGQAKFTPEEGLSGRAGFDFTVTDADGDSWTQTCNILLTGK
jgi:hypothetical protein